MYTFNKKDGNSHNILMNALIFLLYHFTPKEELHRKKFYNEQSLSLKVYLKFEIVAKKYQGIKKQMENKGTSPCKSNLHLI